MIKFLVIVAVAWVLYTHAKPTENLIGIRTDFVNPSEKIFIETAQGKYPVDILCWC